MVYLLWPTLSIRYWLPIREVSPLLISPYSLSLPSQNNLNTSAMALIKSISGIRGTIGGETGENLTPLDVVKFTAAYGSIISGKNKKTKIVIGRDGRISGAMVRDLVASTLAALGIDV